MDIQVSARRILCLLMILVSPSLHAQNNRASFYLPVHVDTVPTLTGFGVSFSYEEVSPLLAPALSAYATDGPSSSIGVAAYALDSLQRNDLSAYLEVSLSENASAEERAVAELQFSALRTLAYSRVTNIAFGNKYILPGYECYDVELILSGSEKKTDVIVIVNNDGTFRQARELTTSQAVQVLYSVLDFARKSQSSILISDQQFLQSVTLTGFPGIRQEMAPLFHFNAIKPDWGGNVFAGDDGIEFQNASPPAQSNPLSALIEFVRLYGLRVFAIPEVSAFLDTPQGVSLLNLYSPHSQANLRELSGSTVADAIAFRSSRIPFMTIRLLMDAGPLKVAYLSVNNSATIQMMQCLEVSGTLLVVNESEVTPLNILLNDPAVQSRINELLEP